MVFRATGHPPYRSVCLAGPVRTNNTDDLACLDVKADIREHRLVNISLGNRINAQQDLSSCFIG